MAFTDPRSDARRGVGTGRARAETPAPDGGRPCPEPDLLRQAMEGWFPPDLSLERLFDRLEQRR
ncbi:MAG: hypothetical protein AAFU61_11655 [Pseudomonadota bacterium]